MKLRYKLNILILFIIFISISIPFVVNYQFGRNIIKEQVNNYLESELVKNLYDINGWLDKQSQTVVTISDIINNSYEKDELSRSLLVSYINNQDISDIYIGFTDGDFISGQGWIPPKGYDPRVRPWYQEAMKAGKLNISDIYYDLTSQQSAIAIGLPLKDKNGNIIGVISEDILLSTFYNKIYNVHLENYGYAFVLKNDGQVLIHPDQSLIGRNSDDLITGDNKFSTLHNSSGMIGYLYKGKKKLAVYSTIKNTNWKLVLTVYQDQIYEPLRRLLFVYLLVSVFTIAVAFLVTYFFKRNFILRMQALSNASIALSKGNFETDLNDMAKDEIGEVSKAFSRMKIEIQQKITEIELNRMKYKELIENMADAVFSVDNDGNIITANPRFLQICELTNLPGESKNISELIGDKELGKFLITLVDEVIRDKELINRENDKIDNKYYNVTIAPIFDNEGNSVKGATVILHDASEVRHYQEHLEWITHFDALTGLPNRLKFLEDMSGFILRAKIDKRQFAILFIDLDDFKNVNDTLGYEAGDILLQQVTRIIQREYAAYRIGADEFMVILNQYESNQELEQRVEELSQKLKCNHEINFNTIYSSATIGVTMYPKDFDNIYDMMIKVDAALNWAKKRNKSMVQYYEEFISTELHNRVILEKSIRNALVNKEFVLFYQPIINSYTNSIKGFEALIRWKNSDGRMISPGEFMPIAENMSIINEIGFWVIEQALDDLIQFQGIFDINLTMAINISPNQIKLPEFSNKVIDIITRKGVDPHYIEFEITESVLIESMEMAKKQFKTLIDFGIKISLDDFGTGYSSLNYIQYFPFQKVKIDKSFVDYIKQDTTSRSLIKHIIEIAHWMDMEIVAEGVENNFQKDYLLNHNCDYLQGYLFSRPISKDEVFCYLTKND